MKKFTCFLLFLVAACALSAQSPNFAVNPSPSSVMSLPEEADNVAHAKVKNLTNSPVTIRWQRYEVDLPTPLYTLVCDPNTCYGPTTGTQVFTLMPQDSGEMDVHFVNETGLIATALVRLRLVNQANPADTLWVDYHFDSQTLGAQDYLEKTAAKIYPNPAAEYFTIDHAPAVALVRLIALDGRTVRAFQANAAQRYELEGIPAGAYRVVLQNERGRVLQTIPLHKE